MDNLRRKFAGLPGIALPGLEGLVPRSARITAKSKPPRPQASVRVVRCPAGQHRAGLIAVRVNGVEHLAWRRHDAHTAGGLSMLCSASGELHCNHPSPPHPKVDPPVCPHERTPL